MVRGYHCILLESQHLMEFYQGLVYDRERTLFCIVGELIMFCMSSPYVCFGADLPSNTALRFGIRHGILSLNWMVATSVATHTS